jgi:formate hydrogenlyase subunit 4
MIHEVMILDHSGPELAALQLASALKLTIGVAILATLLNPFASGGNAALAAAANVALCLVLAVIIGTIESIIARLKLRAVPQYVLAGIIAASVALLATSWRGGPQ